ncbi:hypothetical protein ACRAWD_03435 [Caulobacter segnis]
MRTSPSRWTASTPRTSSSSVATTSTNWFNRPFDKVVFDKTRSRHRPADAGKRERQHQGHGLRAAVPRDQGHAEVESA